MPSGAPPPRELASHSRIAGIDMPTRAAINGFGRAERVCAPDQCSTAGGVLLHGERVAKSSWRCLARSGSSFMQHSRADVTYTMCGSRGAWAVPGLWRLRRRVGGSAARDRVSLDGERLAAVRACG